MLAYLPQKLHSFTPRGAPVARPVRRPQRPSRRRCTVPGGPVRMNHVLGDHMTRQFPHAASRQLATLNQKLDT